MKKIGLTGNIGTGKSTVAWMLHELGVVVIDTDEIAHQVIAPHTHAWTQIFGRYGKHILLDGGLINRKKLGEIVFRDVHEKKFLEGVVHPHIKEEVFHRLAELKRHGKTYCIIEAPLLYEAHWQDMVDLVVVVACDQEAEIRRCEEKFGLERNDILLRLKNQLPLEEKKRRADIVIDNSGPLEETRVQVERLHRAWERGEF